ncbi:UDP-4-amino-4,6-dideoxy-N-acetyl-beta-L-altrosamine N-acetyltransferase [Candidatus Enterovibrio altilux]|uniref:Flagellin modification protein FlmH n=1 Tax=Candidatus Enterovibrio altilux TaxID=1927128 RepID=A0A291B7M5_9GAMM|nr:UDP-4-amino-4,6-dideoxy-N-acetyl-beta-L-altrosamine N-acetyltransferase [Candidatus Enterovibrio luxaltus]ATF09002.1 flagellin modification protein FlmH [Candidatus Enterovibrio luxaltus]
MTQQIFSATVLLKAMTRSNLSIVREWRNTPATRKKMFTTHEIKSDEHITWFERIQQDSTKLFYLVSIENNDVGIVSFTNINQKNACAEWGFYKNPNTRKGIGLVILHATLNHAFDSLRLKQINSRVLAINPKVLHLHNKLGFTRIDAKTIFHNQQKKMISYFNLVVTNDVWLSHEAGVRKQLRIFSQQSMAL